MAFWLIEAAPPLAFSSPARYQFCVGGYRKKVGWLGTKADLSRIPARLWPVALVICTVLSAPGAARAETSNGTHQAEDRKPRVQATAFVASPRIRIEAPDPSDAAPPHSATEPQRPHNPSPLACNGSVLCDDAQRPSAPLFERVSYRTTGPPLPIT